MGLRYNLKTRKSQKRKKKSFIAGIFRLGGTNEEYLWRLYEPWFPKERGVGIMDQELIVPVRKITVLVCRPFDVAGSFD